MSSLIASSRFAFELFKLCAERSERQRDSRLECLDKCRRWTWLAAFVIGVGALLTYPVDVHAQLFNGFERSVEDTQGRWFTAIRDLVRPTFMLLGTIEICWAAAIWVFERDNLSSFAVEVIKKIMTIGFFFVLLEHAPTWIPAIFQSFEDAGTQATGILNDTRSDGQGGPPRLSTDGILVAGVELALRLWTSIKIPAGLMLAVPLTIMGTTIPGAAAIHETARSVMSVAAIGSAIIAISYVIVAAQYFCLKVESAILFAAGAIFLGMGSSSWTREYVSKYLNYAINVGVRMLVLILVLSLTLNGINNFDVRMTVLDMRPILEVMAAAILQAILATKAPELAGALLSGGAGFTAGGASGAGASMVRSMASGAAAMANTAKGVGNLVKAANAGRTSGAGQHAGMSVPGMSGGASARPDQGAAIAGLSSANGGTHKLSGAAQRSSPGRSANLASDGANASSRQMPGRSLNTASSPAPTSGSSHNAEATERPTSSHQPSGTQEGTGSQDDALVSTLRDSPAGGVPPDDAVDDEIAQARSTANMTLTASTEPTPPVVSSANRVERLKKGSGSATPGPREPGPRTER